MMSFLQDNPVYVLGLGLLLVVLLLLWAVSKLRGHGRLTERQKVFISSKWSEVQNLKDENPKLAILEADKLLDYALGCRGAHGNLGDKLKSKGAIFSDLNAVWAAHKLRNRIAHELDLRLATNEVQNALKKFERALRDLQAL
jgi:hypothetical protein